MSEAEALEALDEGRKVGNVDALMVNVDSSEFQKLDADDWRHFEDEVKQVVLSVASDEPDADVVVAAGLDGGVLLPDESDDVL